MCCVASVTSQYLYCNITFNTDAQMKLNDLPHLQQSGFCWSRLTGQKSLRIKPITPVYSVYGDALFMHNVLSGHNGNHGRFVWLNKGGIICWPFSTLVCRCLLWWTLSGRKILSLFMQKVSEMPTKAIVRAVSQCSLFQWLSEGIKWNFINKGCNCLVRCGGEALSMWGFLSLSGPFQCCVCTSSCDAFTSSRSRRGIPLSRATLHLPNIVFFLARIQQSLSVLKDLACILSGRTARSNKAPRAMQRAPPLCRRDL